MCFSRLHHTTTRVEVGLPTPMPIMDPILTVGSVDTAYYWCLTWPCSADIDYRQCRHQRSACSAFTGAVYNGPTLPILIVGSIGTGTAYTGAMYNGPALPILSVNRLRRLPDDPYCPLGDIGHVSQQRELSPNSPNLPSLEASFLANNVASENVFAHTALERKPGHGGKWSMKRNHLSSPAELKPTPR